MFNYDRDEIYIRDKKHLLFILLLTALFLVVMFFLKNRLMIGWLSVIILCLISFTLNLFVISSVAILNLIVTLINLKGIDLKNISLLIIAEGLLFFFVIKIINSLKEEHKKIYLSSLDNEADINEIKDSIKTKERKVEALKLHIKRHKSIKNLAEKWIKIKNFDDFLRSLVSNIQNFIGCDRVILQLKDKEGKIQRTECYPDTMGEPLFDIYNEWVRNRNENLIVKDTYKDVRFKKDESIKREIGSLIICQINLKEESFGYLRLESTTRDSISVYTLRLADALSELLAVLIKRNNLIAEVEKLARVDGLTGLFKRWYFDIRFEKEYLMAKRYNYRFGLIICDIDHFKRINDTYGHSVGDIILSRCADIFKNVVEPYGIHCRFGGEEFLGLLRRCDRPETKKIAEELRTRILDMDNIEFKNSEKVSVSVGFSVFPDDSIDGEKLFQIADEALYKAKKQGRNRCFGGEDLIK
ncbi:MAG: diguanylate cyclase [Candidatus Hydrogenedentota bacterium]